jgi:5'-3' exonuclease
VPQWADAAAFFEAFGWTVLGHDTLEADDLLGSLAQAELAAGGSALLFTGDRDMFQCVGDRVTVLYPGGGRGEPTAIGPAEVRERYGVEPKQVPDFIALRGDPSDRLPGAPGIGPKKAAEILQQYGSLEGAIKAGRFSAQAEELRLYRRIATLDASAPLPPLDDQSPSWAEASNLLRSWGLNGPADRLAARAG